MLNKKRIILGTLGAAAAVALVLTQTAASKPHDHNPQARFKLGGAWVGELDGVQWVSTHAPLDADGKTAAGKLQWLAVSAPFQSLTAALGADHMSDAVGSFEMINKNTAKYTLTFYSIASGTASLDNPVGDQVKAINVMTGLWHYTGPDTAESTETLTVYAVLPTAEQHLFPGPGTVPIVTNSFDWHPQYRVTVP